jgi:hypothetical protein
MTNGFRCNSWRWKSNEIKSTWDIESRCEWQYEIRHISTNWWFEFDRYAVGDENLRTNSHISHDQETRFYSSSWWFAFTIDCDWCSLQSVYLDHIIARSNTNWSTVYEHLDSPSSTFSVSSSDMTPSESLAFIAMRDTIVMVTNTAVLWTESLSEMLYCSQLVEHFAIRRESSMGWTSESLADQWTML